MKYTMSMTILMIILSTLCGAVATTHQVNNLQFYQTQFDQSKIKIKAEEEISKLQGVSFLQLAGPNRPPPPPRAPGPRLTSTLSSAAAPPRIERQAAYVLPPQPRNTHDADDEDDSSHVASNPPDVEDKFLGHENHNNTPRFASKCKICFKIRSLLNFFGTENFIIGQRASSSSRRTAKFVAANSSRPAPKSSRRTR
jgi:hypothetical protein